jgi:hypothetical protein
LSSDRREEVVRVTWDELLRKEEKWVGQYTIHGGIRQEEKLKNGSWTLLRSAPSWTAADLLV